MEGLAYLITILFMIVILGGPVAILLTKIRTAHIVLTIIRRLLHGFVITVSLFVNSIVFWKSNQPFALHAIGIFGISMAYIALRREYFPDVRIIAPLLRKLGLRKDKAGKADAEVKEGQDSAGHSTHNSSPFGPLMKWRRNGSSGEDDGHGPGGQH